MQDKYKGYRPRRGLFYWKIPGDVPGYQSQPDPFQSRRADRHPDYQLARSANRYEPEEAKTSVGSRALQSGTNAIASVVSGRALQSGAGAIASVIGGRAEQSATGSLDSRSGRSSDRRSSICPILALLLLLLLGFMGYDKFGPNAESTPNLLVTNTGSSDEPKIVNVILGAKNRTPKSKLRVVTHMVVKGDTLWDIAETYVKDPFRYPELAELSKIKNPDLIYPYDLVRIHIYED